MYWPLIFGCRGFFFGLALDWMDANQLGRRNLTPDAFRLLLGRRYNRVKKAAGFQSAGPGRGKTIDQIDPVFTADRLAAEHGESRQAIAQIAGVFGWGNGCNRVKNG